MPSLKRIVVTLGLVAIVGCSGLVLRPEDSFGMKAAKVKSSTTTRRIRANCIIWRARLLRTH